MNRSQHVGKDDLLKFIQGTDESAEVRAIGEHVHKCVACREELDALTAQSAIWIKAPRALKSVAGLNLDDRQLETNSNCNVSDDDSGSADETNWHYAIDELLDRPKHPEMLGRVGKYDIEREIGRGGMGVVLKAFDAELNRPVAIKILAPHLASHGTARKRFAQEGIAAAGIMHPNVIAVYGVNHEGKAPYIVMPLIDGPSLQSLVDQNGPLSEIEIVRAALQISSGLAAAHAQGLIHRDIKPANILTEGGVQRVIITDFGLARAEDDASLTRTGWLMGTPNYMSPEQTRGQRADARSDLFSLGSLMYFLATGRLPFRAETSLAVLNRIQNDQPTPVCQVNPNISRTLSEVIELLLQKAPEARFQKCSDVQGLLEQYLAYLHRPDISNPPKVPKAKELRPTNPKRIAVTLLLVTTLGIAAGYSGLIPSPFRNVEPTTHISKELASAALQEPGSPDENKILSLAKNEANLCHFARAEELCNRVLKINPLNEDAATNLGYVIHKQGRFNEAYAWHERAAKTIKFKGLGNYNLACYHAMQGESDKAFQFLVTAIESRLSDHLCKAEVESDPDLESLRSDPRFKAAIKAMP